MCPLGYQDTSNDRSRCQLCPTGFYQDTLQMAACKVCTLDGALCNLIPGSISAANQPAATGSIELPKLSTNDVVAMHSLTLKEVQEIQAFQINQEHEQNNQFKQCKAVDDVEAVRASTFVLVYALLFVAAISVLLSRKFLCLMCLISSCLYFSSKFHPT